MRLLEIYLLDNLTQFTIGKRQEIDILVFNFFGLGGTKILYAQLKSYL